MRHFVNSNNLPLVLVVYRLRGMDPHAQAERGNRLTQAGEVEIVNVDSTLTDAQINGALIYAQTAEETAALADFLNSSAAYAALNGWWSDTATGTVDRITNAIFGGKSETQLHADIDALPATIAGMKTGLKSAASAIIATRTILTYMARAIVFLRDYAIRARR